ncbi:uncharacterized protein MYCGRDRAFT_97988 [Zymoseptoria tritici IPO323]|uniref:Uncharacterized protein n=1 Tax=Zymoseptoria tritici (strain CBS 115943 / IPO323) TaxID=336722 RepID=F9XRZ8_ZYMTI|nr:uncharacterized protein MYCGRDRAFT_97988 [Zymoseptoria tritici IPO323]EGP82015.1 hypothetical protein MYCGRDRAFT_97988 [Zymoseptoria tritici IPO323]
MTFSWSSTVERTAPPKSYHLLSRAHSSSFAATTPADVEVFFRPRAYGTTRSSNRHHSDHHSDHQSDHQSDRATTSLRVDLADAIQSKPSSPSISHQLLPYPTSLTCRPTTSTSTTARNNPTARSDVSCARTSAGRNLSQILSLSYLDFDFHLPDSGRSCAVRLAMSACIYCLIRSRMTHPFVSTWEVTREESVLLKWVSLSDKAAEHPRVGEEEKAGGGGKGVVGLGTAHFRLTSGESKSSGGAISLGGEPLGGGDAAVVE